MSELTPRRAPDRPRRTWCVTRVRPGVALLSIGAALVALACGDDGARGAHDSAVRDLARDTAPSGDAADDASNGDTTTPEVTMTTEVTPETTDATTPEDDAAPQDDTAAEDAAADLDVAPAEPPCPAITVAEGLTVMPPTTLHLSGLTTTGTVATWRWSIVSAPEGLVSTLVPGTGVAEPRLDATLAGTYRLRLDALDKRGEAACDPAEVEVVARPGPGIHLELVWDDNTADPTLEVGADLDLHVFRHDAVGLDTDSDGTGDGWFDPLYDCAWHNPDPVWPAAEGAPNPAPRLLRRDDAGYGPEVIAVPSPEATTYVVGFHVWDDDDAIYLAPTEIRIWIDGVWKNRPTFSVPVKAPSLERVMTVTWPSGQLGFPFAKDGDFIPTSPTK